MTDKTFNMDDMPLRRGHFRVVAVASMGQLTGAALATLVGIILPMLQIVRNPSLSSLAQGLVGLSLIHI